MELRYLVIGNLKTKKLSLNPKVKQSIILSFISFGKKITHELKLEDFNKSGLIRLANYGADVTENNVLTLVNVLQDEK